MKFTPEDFHSYVCGFTATSISPAEELAASRICDLANAKLEAWLKDAPAVEWHYWLNNWATTETHKGPQFENKNLKAKLVQIEEIK